MHPKWLFSQGIIFPARAAEVQRQPALKYAAFPRRDRFVLRSARNEGVPPLSLAPLFLVCLRRVDTWDSRISRLGRNLLRTRHDGVCACVYDSKRALVSRRRPARIRLFLLPSRLAPRVCRPPRHMHFAVSARAFLFFLFCIMSVIRCRSEPLAFRRVRRFRHIWRVSVCCGCAGWFAESRRRHPSSAV